MPNNEEEILEESVENKENSKNEEENLQPAVEEPASSIDEDIEQEVKAKAKLSKKALKLILKNPYFWIIIGLFSFIILIAILMFDFDFDIAGVGKVRPQYYETSCNKIKLTWENESYILKKQHEGTYEAVTKPEDVDLTDTERYSYKEYDFDTYISGIVWNDNSTFGDVNNDIVYEAMSIAARSRIIANLHSNCVILKDNNPENFRELLGTETKYSEITAAVNKTTGLIISRDNSILNANYDSFSYVKKYKEANSEYSNRGLYYMMNKNEEGNQTILSDWVEENNIMVKKVSSYTYLNSLSVYGSKYLLEMVNSQYDLYRILEYYYGRDIEYYTIDYAFSDEYNPDCSYINMKDTSLTKEEFISLVSSISNGKAKELINNAATIYDMGVNNGVNPELVFIRASVEGYSPGESKNNFWGIGCTNTGGSSACHSYNSVSEGVMAFYKIVKQYNTLEDFAGRYAYLGDYWYNPGSAGIGGCYYANVIFDVLPEHVQQACAENKSCKTSGGGDCVATTDEDKHAYLVFQSQTMLKARKNIFGIDADTCATDTPIGTPGNGSCTIWKQGDSRWGNINLGTSKSKMSNSGCAVTSLAIAMSCSGTPINNVAAFNPGTFVRKINSIGGFTERGGVYWNNAAISYFAPLFRYKGGESLKNLTVKDKLEKVTNITKENNGNTAILLHFVNDKHQRGHWVVLKTISGNNFIVYDPAGNEPDVNTYSAKDLDDIRIYYF